MGQLPHYRKSTIPEHAKKVFEGVIFDVYQWEQELYDGSQATFELVNRPDTAVVYPVMEDGRIMLVEDEQPNREVLLRSPSGRVEEGETPEEATRRELLEEVGVRVGTIELFYTEQREPKVDHIIYVFIAKGCKKVQEPQVEAGEKITPKIVSFDELVQHALKNELDGRGFRTRALEAINDAEKMKLLKTQFEI